MSEEVIEYNEDEKKHFDTYVENLTGFYESMKVGGLVKDYEILVNRDTFDIKTSLWLNLPTRQVIVTICNKDDGQPINLLEECDA